MSTAATVPHRVTLPGAGHVLREALVDFYFHSGRFVAANAAWATCVVAILALGLLAAPAALLLLPLGAIPAVGISRMAGAVVRGGEFVDARQFRVGMRHRGLAALAAAVALSIATVVLAGNLAIGVAAGGAMGWAFAVLAAWGLLAAWAWAFAFWPLLGDPLRLDVPASRLARLAIAVVLVRPGRMAAGVALVVLLLAASTVLVVVRLATGVAYASLVAAQWTLPLADLVDTPAGDAA